MRASPVKRALSAARTSRARLLRSSSLGRLARRSLGAPWLRASRARTAALPDRSGILLPLDRPQEIVPRHDFGLILSDDGGASWVWTCEQARDLDGERLYASARRRAIASTRLSPLTGLAFSDDESCSWQRAGGALDAARRVSDFFVDPSDPMRVLAAATPVDATAAARRRRRSSLRPTVARRSTPTPLYTAPAARQRRRHRDRAQRSAGHLSGHVQLTRAPATRSWSARPTADRAGRRSTCEAALGATDVRILAVDRADADLALPARDQRRDVGDAGGDPRRRDRRSRRR